MTGLVANVVPSWLPSGMGPRLDLSELSEVSPAIRQIQQELEWLLDCHVAVYRSEVRGREHGLCSMYRAARLTLDQQGLLKAAEERFPDTVFVAYAKPLTYQRCVNLCGHLIPRIGLGTMRLIGSGAWGPPADQAQSARVLQEAVQHGIRLLDAADAYGPGHSETLIAKALHPYPDDLILCTKGGIDRRGPDQWIPNGNPSHLRKACEASLRRLRVEAIPLYLLHVVDPEVPIEDSVGEMDQLRSRGKILSIGLCNVSVKQIDHASRVAPIACVQNLYNFGDRTHQDVVTYCTERQIPFVAWGPLDGGRLASRSSTCGHAANTPATECLRWILHQSPLTIPIPGAATVDELLDDVAALG